MRILTVFTGGTIGCTNNDGIISPDRRNSYLILDMFRKGDSDVDFYAVQPFSLLSENICADDLQKLLYCLKENKYEDFDGVIITHGTDTLQYTASFLSYVLGLCSVPVVLVSANYPLADERSNGLENLRAAVDFIRVGGEKGVFVAYKNSDEPAKIHRGSRLLAHSAYSDTLHSIYNCHYGIVVDRKFEKNPHYAERQDELTIDFDKGFPCGRVLKLTQQPLMKYPPITEDIKVILIEGYHSGTLNTKSNEFEQFCRIAEENEVPIFLTGSAEGFCYESKLRFDDLKINVLPEASPIAIYMKLTLLSKANIYNVLLPCGGDMLC